MRGEGEGARERRRGGEGENRTINTTNEVHLLPRCPPGHQGKQI